MDGKQLELPPRQLEARTEVPSTASVIIRLHYTFLMMKISNSCGQLKNSICPGEMLLNTYTLL